MEKIFPLNQQQNYILKKFNLLIEKRANTSDIILPKILKTGFEASADVLQTLSMICHKPKIFLIMI